MATHDTTRAAGSAQSQGGVKNAAASPFEAYDAQIAAADLRSYQMSGPRPWTRILIEALNKEGVEGATLLDIGGGIGVVVHELLEAGAVRATSIEASSAYLVTARDESDRRGLIGQVTFQQGDFVELADSIPPADIVTLERVLNVYPDWERLALLAAEHARRLYGVVVPRDTRFVRLVIVGINLVLRLRHQRLRAAVVPPDAIDGLANRAGLRRCFSRPVGPAWQVLLYRRDQATDSLGRPQ